MKIKRLTACVPDGESEVCVARNAPKSWLESYDTAKRGRDADAATSVSTQCNGDYPRRNCAAAPTAAASSEMTYVIGIAGTACPRIMTACANSDFMHVRNSDYYGAGSTKPSNRFCVLDCNALDEISSLAVNFSHNLELNLDSHRNTIQKTERFPCFPTLRAGLCVCNCIRTC